jgi:DnaJ-class molecular chaperone
MNSINCPQCVGSGRITYQDLGEVECQFCSGIGHFVIPERCNVCRGKMVTGKAFMNTLLAFADFGDDAGHRGTTQTRNGPPVLIYVLKCEDCGHSFSI